MKMPILLLLTCFMTMQLFAQESNWTSKDRNDFVVECVKAAKAGMSEDSAKYYCYCMLTKIEAKYPDTKDAATISEADMASPEWRKMIESCLGKYWTNDQRNEFMFSCTSAATQLGEENAKYYCECMMYKIENKYHSYAEASKITAQTLQKPEWQKLIRSCLK